MTDQVAILFENSELLQRVTDQTEVWGFSQSVADGSRHRSPPGYDP